MRGFRIGAGLHGALAAVSGMLTGLDFRARELPPPMPRAQYKKTFFKEKGPRQRGNQRGGKDRLIVDRSSSVRKLQRYLNNGTIVS